MNRWKRSIFFWSLVTLFLVTAPLVVLHTRGYRFDLSRGVFVYSGSIIFKSNPQAVDVKLNDKLAQSKKINQINSSYNMTGLLPGDYNIQISADGFQTWSKKTDVHSGVASEFWNTLLVRNNYPKTDNVAYGIDKFFTSPKNRFIAYTQNKDSGLTVSLFNINTKTIDSEFDFSDWNFIDESRKENIEWSPEESFISVPVRNTDGYAYFIVDPDVHTFFNLNQFLETEDIRDVRWDPKEKGYLFFLSGNALYRTSISDAATKTQIISDASSYDLSSSGVYYVKFPNNLIFKNSLDGKSDPVQITSTFPGPENTSISRMVIYDESRIALISQNKDLYVFNKGEIDDYFKKLEEEVEDAHFSNDGKKLLFWSNNGILVYFLRNWNVQPIRNENELQSITRYSETIKNVQWFSDYEHIIFSTGRWVKIIELDPRDHRNSMDLANTSLENSFVIYNGFLDKLYFTDSLNDSTTLYSIIFPEQTSLLGIIGVGG